jgi:hypothetical protein
MRRTMVNSAPRGQWRDAAGGERLTVENPATGRVLAEVASGEVADARAAVQEALARLIVMEHGKVLSEARSEVAYAAEFLRWFAEDAVRTQGSIGPAPGGAGRMIVLRQPIGVSVFVTPWNFPAAMATRKIGPALAAGCTVVLKPASETPLTALAMASIFETAGTPPGVLNVVPSRQTGELVSSDAHRAAFQSFCDAKRLRPSRVCTKATRPNGVSFACCSTCQPQRGLRAGGSLWGWKQSGQAAKALKRAYWSTWRQSTSPQAGTVAASPHASRNSQPTST